MFVTDVGSDRSLLCLSDGSLLCLKQIWEVIGVYCLCSRCGK